MAPTFKRVPNWPDVLQQMVEAGRFRPFEWGGFDCAIAARGFVSAITGGALPPAADEWDSALSAARLLDRKPLRVLAAEWFGEPVAGWKQARRGDVGIILGERDLPGFNEYLCVVVGRDAVTTGPAGLVGVPLSKLVLTWRIG